MFGKRYNHANKTNNNNNNDDEIQGNSNKFKQLFDKRCFVS